jgi:beta-lactamase regulating signal transducer with metallopeptidase domain
MDLFIYLGKASLILTLFWVVYKLVLEVETYHRFKRIYLLVGYVLSLILPLFTFTRIEEITLVSTGFVPSSSEFVPVEMSKSPMELFWSFVTEHSIIQLIYVVISLVFVVHLSIKFFKLLRFLKSSRMLEFNGSFLIQKAIPEGAFSFLNYIVYNPELYSEAELKIILAHEQAHINKKHSLDILFAHMYKCLFWFNPLAWLYQKSLILNLEYEADANAVNTTAKRDYQMTLYSITQQQYKSQLQQSFHQSPIKKRIAMLNQNKKQSFWKLFIVSPVLVVFFLLFQVETKAQIKEANTKLNTETSNFQKEIEGIKNAEIFIINGKTIDKEELVEKYIPVEDFQYDDTSKTLSVTTRTEFSRPYYSDNLAMFKEIQLKDKALGEFIYFIISSEYKVATMKVENIETSENTKQPLLNKNISLSNMSSKSEKRFLEFKSEYDNQKMIFIIDGVKAENGEIVNIDTDQIESVEILKSPEELKAEGYNSNFIDAVIKVTTKKAAAVNASQNENSNNKALNTDGSVIYLVNGEEVDYKNLNEIAPRQIQSVDVIKSLSKIKDLGFDSIEVDGIMKITTKKANPFKNITPKIDGKASKSMINSRVIFILDGKELDDDQIKNVNPEDIQSMDVIKSSYDLKQAGYDPKEIDGIIKITLKKEVKKD